jgi:hypothetical protein
VSYLSRKNKEVPYIRLSGEKLENLGFGIGNEFKLTTEPNKLILERIQQ